MVTVYLGVGSNVGDSLAHMGGALSGLARSNGIAWVRMSSVITTDPVGPVQQGKFLNAAIELRTSLSPQALHQLLRELEAQAGREPVGTRQRWGPRTLDLDILLYGDAVIDDAALTVPHPSMHERWFVLAPLAELGPNAMHPLLKESVAKLLAELPSPG